MRQGRSSIRKYFLIAVVIFVTVTWTACGNTNSENRQTEKTQEVSATGAWETEGITETDNPETAESGEVKETGSSNETAESSAEAETKASEESQTQKEQQTAETVKPSDGEQKETVWQTKAAQQQQTAAQQITEAPAQTDAAANTTEKKLAAYNAVLRTDISENDLAKVDTIIGQIITAGMSPQEKIKAVHDWMVKNIYYDTALKSYDVHTALFSGKTVCQGYAETFYVFMGELGISCQNISGNAFNGSKSESHMWNAVMLEKEWYYIDITWDDPMMEDTGSSNYPDGSNMSYDYFLIPYSVMAKDHTESVAVPSPNGTSMAYYEWAVSLGNKEKADALAQAYSGMGYTTYIVNTSGELDAAISKVNGYGNYAVIFHGGNLSADTVKNRVSTHLNSHTSDYFNKGYKYSCEYGTDGTTDIWYFCFTIQTNMG